MTSLHLFSSVGDKLSRTLSAPPAPRVMLASADTPDFPKFNAQASARAFFFRSSKPDV
jgi:hypothetical protein